MKKKMKLSYKAVLSLILSAVLFCMPAVGFAMNGNYATEVHAEDSTGENETATEGNTEQETESPTESSTEQETESTVSGNDVPEQVCICEDKCSSYDYDHTCEVCAGDYKKCAYKKPNVTININKPDGWYNDTAKVSISAVSYTHLTLPTKRIV